MGLYRYQATFISWWHKEANFFIIYFVKREFVKPARHAMKLLGSLLSIRTPYSQNDF